MTPSHDWTYTPHFWGRHNGASVAAPDVQLPLALLTAADPILWFKHIPLYEDELDDNGICRLYVKIRVMDACWFVLMRYELRVDNVLLRLVETRLFHQFGHNHILRNFIWKETTFDQLANEGESLEPGSPIWQFDNAGCGVLQESHKKVSYMEKVHVENLTLKKTNDAKLE
eukprot:Platyproteum_vivax@DN5656_c0_g1_i2.p1